VCESSVLMPSIRCQMRITHAGIRQACRSERWKSSASLDDHSFAGLIMMPSRWPDAGVLRHCGGSRMRVLLRPRMMFSNLILRVARRSVRSLPYVSLLGRKCHTVARRAAGLSSFALRCKAGFIHLSPLQICFVLLLLDRIVIPGLLRDGEIGSWP
jgi:hypothetical protein